MTQQATQTDASVLDELRWRGLIHVTEQGHELYTPGLDDLLTHEKITAYIGFDPSADSLHIGNLLVIMLLVRMQRHGHTPIAIAGGGTGLIGDPGGKTEERQLLTREQMAENLAGIRTQLARFLDFDARDNPAHLVNNLDWLDRILAIDFLRDVGKHFSVNYMLAKESVRSRIQQGISYTEFSYMLLQAYDYLALYDRFECVLQMGGSDQWGNIIAGIDLIRRDRGGHAHALVAPLITDSAGNKFGKTESGAVWLDPKKTSPYQFYQYWLNTADEDVGKLMRCFTLLGREEIVEIEERLTEHPERREAQRRLAEEVTRMTHGDDALRTAQTASEALFGGDVSSLGAAELLDVFHDVPSSDMPRERLEGEGVALTELLTLTGLAASRGEARRLIQGNGIALGSRRETDPRRAVRLEDAVDGSVVVLRRGARQWRLVRLRG